MSHDVIFAGFGGQGVLTAGLVLAQMGVDAGLEVLWSPAYGGEMRGGKAYSMVKLSNQAILDPVCSTLDALVAMNGPSLDFCTRLMPGGLLVVNDTIDPALIPAGDKRILRVPLQQLADKAGTPRGANLVAAGCIAAWLNLFSSHDADESVHNFFIKKGKAALGDSAAAAMLAGWNYYEEV